jgi:gliding motility-associated-like protein
MKRFWTTILFLLVAASVWATHNRAGYICYEHVTGNQFKVTIVLFTYTGSSVNRDSVPISWGDGSADQQLPRTAISTDGALQVQTNEYTGFHTYPGPGKYILRVEDPNRKGNSVNIPNSDSWSFCIETMLNTKLSANSTPIPQQPPVAYANVNDTFTYNPTMWDKDGDSLAYELVPSRGNGCNPIPGYLFPDQIGANGPFTLDPVTGQILWTVPRVKGEYNVAIKVKEYSFGLDSVSGYKIIDLHIIVLDELNDPPRVQQLRDTCVIAGAHLNMNVNAWDPNSGDRVTLSASGGPFQVATSPATFPTTSSIGSTNSVFDWQTSCDHVRKQFYEVVFKAEDDYTNASNEAKPLIDVSAWLITVVAPAPQNLTATVTPIDEVRLAWDSLYACGTHPNFKGFSIWRKVGSNTFTPDECETGLAGRGYTRIARRITDYHYVDAGLTKGALYCYRILAEFTDGAQSITSNEDCVELKKDVPVITHVDVNVTDAVAGEIIVSWTKPDPVDLDTVQNFGPYEYRLFRAANRDGSGASQIASFTAASFYQLNDVTHTDVGLNTESNIYSYFLEFYTKGGVYMGNTAVASSVFISLAANDRQLTISWDENVPWFNYEYEIYGRPANTSGTFNYIATTTAQSYTDSGLVNGDTYCYYVVSNGIYGSASIPDTLVNRSQRTCGIPKDTIPPCPPVLTVTNHCTIEPEGKWIDDIEIANTLDWTNPETIGCADDVDHYNVYYAPTLDEPMTLLVSTTPATDTHYVHQFLTSLAGCYMVTAVDVWGNESAGNRVCVDNCPYYELPNVFTPNGDAKHDFFTPILPYRFVTRIDMQIRNRWGEVVYRTDNPDILWNGKDRDGSNEVAEGYYFYVVDIYTLTLEGEEKIRLKEGFIKLIR